MYIFHLEGKKEKKREKKKKESYRRQGVSSFPIVPQTRTPKHIKTNLPFKKFHLTLRISMHLIRQIYARD